VFRALLGAGSSGSRNIYRASFPQPSTGNKTNYHNAAHHRLITSEHNSSEHKDRQSCIIPNPPSLLGLERTEGRNDGRGRVAVRKRGRNVARPGIPISLVSRIGGGLPVSPRCARNFRGHRGTESRRTRQQCGRMRDCIRDEISRGSAIALMRSLAKRLTLRDIRKLHVEIAARSIELFVLESRNAFEYREIKGVIPTRQ